MKFSIALCLLMFVLIQQCMSAHIHHEKKNDEDHKTHMSHERGDHKGHKHEDWDCPDHMEEDHIAHEHGFIDHRIHKHEDHTTYNPRLDFHH